MFERSRAHPRIGSTVIRTDSMSENQRVGLCQLDQLVVTMGWSCSCSSPLFRTKKKLGRLDTSIWRTQRQKHPTGWCLALLHQTNHSRNSKQTQCRNFADLPEILAPTEGYRPDSFGTRIPHLELRHHSSEDRKLGVRTVSFVDLANPRIMKGKQTIFPINHHVENSLMSPFRVP